MADSVLIFSNGIVTTIGAYSLLKCIKQKQQTAAIMLKLASASMESPSEDEETENGERGSAILI